MAKEITLQSSYTKDQIKLRRDMIRQLEEEIRKIKKHCPHENTEYWQDASGNNGGGWICNDCGGDA